MSPARLSAELMNKADAQFDRASLDRHICAITQKIDEIKGQVYEAINKHFQEFSTSFEAISELQEELHELTSKVVALKEKAKVCPKAGCKLIILNGSLPRTASSPSYRLMFPSKRRFSHK